MYAGSKFLHVITQPIKNEGRESNFKEKLKFFLLSLALYSLDKLYSCEYILSSNFKKYIQLIILALGLRLRCWHNLVYFIWNVNKDNLYWIERVSFSVLLRVSFKRYNNLIENPVGFDNDYNMYSL